MRDKETAEGSMNEKRQWKRNHCVFHGNSLDETNNQSSLQSTDRVEENKAKINHVQIVKNTDRKVSDQ